MEKETITPNNSEGTVEQIKEALEALEQEWVEVDGKRMKPSQCYHFEVEPLHVLFNTNCPDELKEKVETILSRYGAGK